VGGVNLVLEILGEIVGRKRTIVVMGGINQYAVECPPQPLSVAFVDADLVLPVSVVLVGVQRPHRLHPLVPLRLVRMVTTSPEAPLIGSCASTGSTTVGFNCK